MKSPAVFHLNWFLSTSFYVLISSDLCRTGWQIIDDVTTGAFQKRMCRWITSRKICSAHQTSLMPSLYTTVPLSPHPLLGHPCSQLNSFHEKLSIYYWLALVCGSLCWELICLLSTVRTLSLYLQYTQKLRCIKNCTQASLTSEPGPSASLIITTQYVWFLRAPKHGVAKFRWWYDFSLTCALCTALFPFLT